MAANPFLMNAPSHHFDPDQILAQSQSPVMKMITGLATDRAGEIADPDVLAAVMLWTRSTSPNMSEFDDPLAAQADYQHLGFLDDRGELLPEHLTAGRAFMRDHWNEAPNHARFWRHLKAAQRQVQPENLTADFVEYNLKLAAVMDDGADEVAIAEAVLEADRQGMNVPTTPLWQADRVRLTFATIPEAQHRQVYRQLAGQNLNWFPPDTVASALRRLLKEPSYELSEAGLEQWLEDQGHPSLRRQLASLPGRGRKAQQLRDLGLLDEHWRWSEIGYQHFQQLVQELNQTGQPADFERLRWEAHKRYLPAVAVPFEWTLLNDTLTEPVVHRARRAASIALSGGLLGESVEVGDTVPPAQIQTLRQVGAWVYGPEHLANWPALYWLNILGNHDDISWDNWKQICSFVTDKLDRAPEPELLRDWQAGIVTFEGHGRHQTPDAQPFSGAEKVGRNDPCSCGSGKKFKKCCGR